MASSEGRAIGYVSPFATSSATSSGGYVSPFAAGGIPTPEKPSPLGFLGNVVEGVEGLATGIAQFAGAGLHDVLDTLAFGKLEGGPELPHMLATVPSAFVHDIAERYGPLVHGEFGKFLDQVYEKPVSFAMDALAVGSVAGKLSELAGGSVVKASEAMSAARAFTEKSLQEAGVAPRVVKAASIRAGLDAVDTIGAWKKLLPSPTFVREGDILRASAEIQNPVARAAMAPLNKLTKMPVSGLQNTVTTALDTLTPDEFANVPELVNQQRFLAEIAAKGEQLGHEITHVEKDFLANIHGMRAFQGARSAMTGAWFRERLQEVKRYTEDLKAEIALNPDFKVTGSARIMGLQNFFGDLFKGDVKTDPVLNRLTEQIGAQLTPGDFTRQSVKLLDDVAPKAAKALEDSGGRDALYVARGRRILDNLDEHVTWLKENKDALTSEQGTEAGTITAGGWKPEEIDQMVTDTLILKDHIIRDHHLMAASEGTTRADLRAVAFARLNDMDINMQHMRDMSLTPGMIINEAYGAVVGSHGFDRVKEVAEVGGKARTVGVIRGEGAQDTYAWDAAFRGNDFQAPTHYPMINPERTGPWDWLMSSSRSKGVKKMAVDKSNLFDANSLLKMNKYIKDPIEAFAIRASRSAKHTYTVRMFDEMTARFGRPITDASQLGPGEGVWSPDFVRLSHHFTDGMHRRAEELVLDGADPHVAALKAFTESMKKAQDGILELSAKDGIKMYAMPKFVMDRMDDAGRASGIIRGNARLFFEGPMNVWRSMVLAGSPRWIVNNILGNSIFTLMQGAPLGRAFHLLEQRFKRKLMERFPGLGKALDAAGLGKTPLLDQVEALLDHAGITDQVGLTYAGIEKVSTPHLGPSTAETKFGKFVETGRNATTGAMGRVHKMANFVRDMNSEIETAFRENAALTALERMHGISATKRAVLSFTQSGDRFKKILEDGISTHEALSAVKEMNHFFGDFANLGPFERGILRPFIFPFWGFYKFQAKLILSFPFEYPLRAEIMQGLANVTNELMSAYGPVPDWLQGALPLGPPGGDVSFLTTTGPNPFSGTFSNPLAGLSWFLKIPIEHFTGRNFFTGQKFSDKDTITPFGSDQAFHIIRDSHGYPVGVEPVGKVTPSITEHLLSQFPQYELLKDAIGKGKTYDTSGLLDVLQGKGTLRNPDGSPKYPVSLLGALSKFAGYPILQDYDLEKYQSFLQQAQDAALSQAQAQYTGGP